MTSRLLAVLLAILTPTAIPTATFAQDNKLNILFIMADDVGRDAVGCYGGTSYETPNIDKLAKSGTRFLHAYSMPVCHPTRTTILTGKYPFQTGNPRWGSFPKKYENQTLAKILQRAGYSTCVVGKWQLSLLSRDVQQPHRMGFDEYCLFGWHEGGRYWQPHIRQNGKLRTDVKDKYGPDVYCDYLIDFMVRNKKKGQPFFAYFPMALCHAVTDDLKKPVAYGPGRKEYESFGEMVEKMDGIIGRLMTALDKHGLRDNTLVIYTTDNGSPASMIVRAEDGRYIQVPVFSIRNGIRIRGGKGTLRDAGIRVPFLVSLPGHIPAGKTSDTMVDFSDFIPTFSSIAGAKKIPDTGGYNFLTGLLKGQKGAKRPWIYAERGKNFCVRGPDWKLYNDGKLFDMKNDPFEKSAIRANKDTPTSMAARVRLVKAFAGLGRGEK